MDVLELAEKIFSEPPKKKNSIVISFENIGDTKTLFEALIYLFTQGMKILYGVDGKVNLEMITLEEFNIMISYFAV